MATELRVPGEEDFNYQHLALIVEDVNAVWQELVEKGVAIDIGPNPALDGTYQMWIHDPD